MQSAVQVKTDRKQIKNVLKHYWQSLAQIDFRMQSHYLIIIIVSDVSVIFAVNYVLGY